MVLVLYKLPSLDARELFRQSGLIHRRTVFVLVKTSRVLRRRVFSVKFSLKKNLAHLLYYFLCNFLITYFFLSLI